MSRAFVKGSEDRPEALPDRPQSAHPNYVTPAGLKSLVAKSDALKARRARIGDEPGDPREQQELQQVERDLRYYSERVERAIPVDPASQPADQVHFGARVDVTDEAGVSHTFMIVGEDEADAASGRVSWASPLARAMMGAKVGDSVDWQRPAGNKILTIKAVASGT